MDAPLALYRRYRPETFAEVIGQDHVTGPLRAALANNRVNHAYLFSGPRGCGKTTSARILARALNCEQGPTPDPCGECQSCVDLGRGGTGSIDVIEIDAASHGGVDDARDLREKAHFAPVSSRYKVYVIDEAHMVTPQGFNALLKVVEEPPPHLRFVFATTEPDKVLPTIRSRTHHYPFRLIPPRLLSGYLTELCEREGVTVEPAALPLVVRAGGGSARDTLSVLDQLIGGAGEQGVTHELATGLLGYTPESLLDEVVDAFAAGDGSSVFSVVDRVVETGQDPRRFTEDLLRRLRDLVVVAAVPDAPATGLLEVAEDAGERLVAQAARFGAQELSRAADVVAAGLTEMRGATAPRLLLELVCARVLLPGADHTSQGVMSRLERLERRMQVSAPDAATPAPGPAEQESTGQAPPPAASAPAEGPAPAPTASTAPATGPSGPSVGATGPDEPHPDHPQPATTPAGDTTAGETTPPGPAAVTPTDGEGPAPVPEEPAGDAAPAAAAPGAAPSPPPEPEGSSQQPAAQTGTGSPLSLADVRRLWPDIVEATKHRRRVTWIHLTQHAQVVGVEGGTLTLGFANSGARDHFMSGGSAEIVRQCARDVVGVDWQVEAITQPGSSGPAAGGAPAEPIGGGTPRGEAAADAPGQAAAPQQPPQAAPEQQSATGPPAEAEDTRPDPRPSGSPDDGGEDWDRDDPDLDEAGLTGAELLERELGAQVIEEVRHE